LPKSQTIKGLERGLQVLQFLQSNPISSLHEVHTSTKISKPSLLRILHTLERSGLVSRRLGDGRYRVSANLTRMARRRAGYDRIAEAAAPVLDRLCQQISWPSDLLVPAGDHMEIVETSQTHSPFLIKVSGIGQPVNWLLSAVGRVYLAFCADKEREVILQRLRKSDKPEDRLAHDPKRLERGQGAMARAIPPSAAELMETRPPAAGPHPRPWFGQHSLDQNRIHDRRIRRAALGRSAGSGGRDRRLASRQHENGEATLIVARPSRNGLI
jgi:DNA-binding IclR family transcriptional regulator